jgi:hypothetical protein
MKLCHLVFLTSVLALVSPVEIAFAQTSSEQQTGVGANSSKAPAPVQDIPVQKMNDAFVQKITRQIAGHEKEPAGKVFKNIQISLFKDVPAATFLIIMNEGYSRALGVMCTHCHASTDFSSDSKRPKRAAREMAAMHRSINEQLAKMQNLDSNPQGHLINCSTCHRGAVDPLASEQ